MLQLILLPRTILPWTKTALSIPQRTNMMAQTNTDTHRNLMLILDIRSRQMFIVLVPLICPLLILVLIMESILHSPILGSVRFHFKLPYFISLIIHHIFRHTMVEMSTTDITRLLQTASATACMRRHHFSNLMPCNLSVRHIILRAHTNTA